MDEISRLDKLRICITTFPSQDKDLSSVTQKFIELFVPLSAKLFIIGSDLLGMPGNKKIKLVKLHKWRSHKSLPMKIAVLILLQLNTCFSLIKVLRKCDIIILAALCELEIMPMLMAKLFRKKVVILQAGSYIKTAEVYYGRRFLGLERSFLTQ